MHPNEVPLNQSLKNEGQGKQHREHLGLITRCNRDTEQELDDFEEDLIVSIPRRSVQNSPCASHGVPMSHGLKLSNNLYHSNVQEEGGDEETRYKDDNGLFGGFLRVGSFRIKSSGRKGELSLKEVHNKKETGPKDGELFDDELGECKVPMHKLAVQIGERIIAREHTQCSTTDIGLVVEEIRERKGDTEEGKDVNRFSSSGIVVVVDIEVGEGHVHKVGGDEKTTKHIKDLFLSIKSEKGFNRGTGEKLLDSLVASNTLVTNFNRSNELCVRFSNCVCETCHFALFVFKNSSFLSVVGI